jgi:hypothetical protein
MQVWIVSQISSFYPSVLTKTTNYLEIPKQRLNWIDTKKCANLNNYLINKTLHLSFGIKKFNLHLYIWPKLSSTYAYSTKISNKKILKPCNRRCRSDHDGDTSHHARHLLCPRLECMSCCTTPTSRRWVYQAPRSRAWRLNRDKRRRSSLSRDDFTYLHSRRKKRYLGHMYCRPIMIDIMTGPRFNNWLTNRLNANSQHEITCSAVVWFLLLNRLVPGSKLRASTFLPITIKNTHVQRVGRNSCGPHVVTLSSAKT